MTHTLLAPADFFCLSLCVCACRPPGARPPQRTREEEWEAEQQRKQAGGAAALDPTLLGNPFENAGSSAPSPNFGAEGSGAPLQTFALDSDFSSDDEGQDGAAAAAAGGLDISVGMAEPSSSVQEAGSTAAEAPGTSSTPAALRADVSHVQCKNREKGGHSQGAASQLCMLWSQITFVPSVHRTNRAHS